MKETTNNCRASRAHNPFDDGARERLRRMGLLTETGSVEGIGLDCAGSYLRRIAV